MQVVSGRDNTNSLCEVDISNANQMKKENVKIRIWQRHIWGLKILRKYWPYSVVLALWRKCPEEEIRLGTNIGNVTVPVISCLPPVPYCTRRCWRILLLLPASHYCTKVQGGVEEYYFYFLTLHQEVLLQLLLLPTSLCTIRCWEMVSKAAIN